MSPSVLIALDVGGTSVKSGVVRVPEMAVSDQARTALDSAGSAEAILGTLAACVLARAERLPGRAGGLAVAFPGPFEYETGICRTAGVCKFDRLYGVDVGRELASRTGIPRIVFLNDAEAAIAGEISYGAGRGFGRVIGVTLGTGMGSGFFVDGVRQSVGEGVPGNGGWLFDGIFQGEAADDCFSIRGMQKRLAAAGLDGRTPEQAAAAALAGDALARAVFEDFGRDLGTFLAGYAEAFQADAVLVGGGISGAFALFGPPLAARLPCPVARGTLGSDAPLLGAAAAFLKTHRR